MKKGYAKALYGKTAWEDSDLERGFKVPPEPDFSEESNWEFANNDKNVERILPLPRGKKVE
jgi:hypothetical protein